MDTVFLFKGIQILSIVVLFVLFVYTKMQKPSEMQKYVSMLSLNMMLMLLGYLLEMQAKTLEGAYSGTIITYIGSPFFMVSVFLLNCTFYGKKVPRWAFTAMMALAIGVTVIVCTNPYHHLYYSYIGYDANMAYSPLVFVRGPLYVLTLITVAGYILGVAIVVASGYKKSMSPLKRRLSVYSLLMIISAVSGYILYFLDVANGYDTTMFGLTGATLCLTILFFRCRIFDVVDMAKDYALDVSAEGLMIFDDAGKLVYENTTASKVVGEIISEEYINGISDEKAICKRGDSVFAIDANSIRHKNDYLGKSVEIHDITESYHYSERLEVAVAETTAKLEGIQRTIIGSFASLVEARSLETGDHIMRVSKYTAMIADELRKNEKHKEVLTEEYAGILVHSAPLHDVGKISISDTILLKPGRLTTEEFEKMKKHAEIGAKIIRTTMEGLESEEYVNMAEEIALCHHERWDGTGYPRGLKGTEIPLSARIVAVADCYDALTSERCYKKSFSEGEALEILKKESGTHFDPEIVEAFINCR